MVPGIAKLPRHVLCPRRREQAAPSPLPALGAGEQRLPALRLGAGLAEGQTDGQPLRSCVGSGMGPCLQPGEGDALSREAFWALLGAATGAPLSTPGSTGGCCPALAFAPPLAPKPPVAGEGTEDPRDACSPPNSLQGHP